MKSPRKKQFAFVDYTCDVQNGGAKIGKNFVAISGFAKRDWTKDEAMHFKVSR
jgi:hypothetical protein